MRETPKPRQMEILRLLLMSGTPLDIEFLKGKLQKSERTIRYDIQELKDLCAPHQIEIRYLKKTGYYLSLIHISLQNDSLSEIRVKQLSQRRADLGFSADCGFMPFHTGQNCERTGAGSLFLRLFRARKIRPRRAGEIPRFVHGRDFYVANQRQSSDVLL